MSSQAFYRKCIREELQRRCAANPRYSARAFARAMQIDAGALSRILAGKQIPSIKMAHALLPALNLSGEQSVAFLASLAETHRARDLRRHSPSIRRLQEAYQKSASYDPPRELSIDLYRVIADWYHVAILELTFTEGFDSQPRSIAKKLGIPQVEAELAVERLLELGLLEVRDGALVKSEANLSTADKTITTPALRKNQKQFLEKAIFSLENDPIEERSHTSMTMAIDPDKLPEALSMIREFNQTLCRFLESGKRTRVYNLGIALYPIQTKEPQK